jgi:hypothetical protein
LELALQMLLLHLLPLISEAPQVLQFLQRITQPLELPAHSMAILRPAQLLQLVQATQLLEVCILVKPLPLARQVQLTEIFTQVRQTR